MKHKRGWGWRRWLALGLVGVALASSGCLAAVAGAAAGIAGAAAYDYLVD